MDLGLHFVVFSRVSRDHGLRENRFEKSSKNGKPQKKLVIAMSLVNNPTILLLDEIFAALDILTIKMLQQIIVSLQTNDNITIILCDHQARDLLSCVDRAVVLSNGKIIADGTPSELVINPTAKIAYFGEEFKFN